METFWITFSLFVFPAKSELRVKCTQPAITQPSTRYNSIKHTLITIYIYTNNVTLSAIICNNCWMQIFVSFEKKNKSCLPVASCLIARWVVFNQSHEHFERPRHGGPHCMVATVATRRVFVCVRSSFAWCLVSETVQHQCGEKQAFCTYPYVRSDRRNLT